MIEQDHKSIEIGFLAPNLHTKEKFNQKSDEIHKLNLTLQ